MLDRLHTSANDDPTARKALRGFLYKVLPTDQDLSSFCLDYFPEVSRRFTSGMDRELMHDLLLKLVDARMIVRELQEHDSYQDAALRHSGMLPGSLRSSTLLRGRFELEVDVSDPLGKGGMGAVYGAVERHTERRWAVKILRKEPLADERSFQRRFEREARVGALINHPNVVQIVATGVSEQGPWLAMERLSGEDLACYLKRYPQGLSLDETTHILESVCAGLAAAHRRGVVHLDLKPENIFLTRDSQVVGSGYGVKLLDLGLARVLDDSQNYSQLQGGTPEYMAPEQQRGGEVSPATDVWAIGLLGFRLLCGEGYGPVVAESEVSATRRAAALGIGARLDAGFDRWFARCLHRSPKERYADAEKAYAAFLQEVRSAAPLPPKVYLLPPLPQPDRTADPAQLRQSRRVWALLPATLLFGTALGYFVGAHRASSAAQATHPPSARRADPAPLALPTAQPSVDLGIPSADQKSLSPSGPQEIPLLREQRPAKPTAGHTLRSGKDSQPRRPAATENRTPKSQELPKSDGVNFPEN